MPCSPLRECRPQAAHGGGCRGFHVRLQLLTRQRMRVQMQTGPGSVIGRCTALQRCFALQRSPGSTTAFKDTIRHQCSRCTPWAQGPNGTRLRHYGRIQTRSSAACSSRRRSREVCYVFETSHRPTGRCLPIAHLTRESVPYPPPARHTSHPLSGRALVPSCRLWSDKCAAWGWVRRESRQVKSSPAPQTGCSSRPRAPLRHGAVMGAPHAPNGTLTARVPPSTMKVPTSLPDASISSFRCETKTVWPAARARTCSASARTF